ncbi:unnamed protein product, partial [Ectocarpus sp. 13 AM-2016]
RSHDDALPVARMTWDGGCGLHLPIRAGSCIVVCCCFGQPHPTPLNPKAVIRKPSRKGAVAVEETQMVGASTSRRPCIYFFGWVHHQVNEDDLKEFGTLSGYLCSQAGEIPAV